MSRWSEADGLYRNSTPHNSLYTTRHHHYSVPLLCACTLYRKQKLPVYTVTPCHHSITLYRYSIPLLSRDTIALYDYWVAKRYTASSSNLSPTPEPCRPATASTSNIRTREPTVDAQGTGQWQALVLKVSLSGQQSQQHAWRDSVNGLYGIRKMCFACAELCTPVLLLWPAHPPSQWLADRQCDDGASSRLKGKDDRQLVQQPYLGSYHDGQLRISM